MVFKEFEVNDPFCHNHSKASHQSLIKLDRDDTVLVPNSSLQLMMFLHHMCTYVHIEIESHVCIVDSCVVVVVLSKELQS